MPNEFFYSTLIAFSGCCDLASSDTFQNYSGFSHGFKISNIVVGETLTLLIYEVITHSYINEKKHFYRSNTIKCICSTHM
jgi:hypothetical protein